MLNRRILKQLPWRRIGRRQRMNLTEKWKEAFASVLPIAAIVLVLCLVCVPAPAGSMLAFLAGAALLVVGMGLFTLGTELAMTPIGEHVGSAMTRSRKLWIVLFLSFLLGIIVTLSEPDLQVLAEQVPGVPNLLLITAVAIGVGLFLMIAMLRILLRIPMKWLLLGSYLCVFVLSHFVPDSFLAVAFDSGGVTTGPMTVPFILALGVGVSSIRSDANAENDSFGLVALCSVGPILAVMILGLIFQPDEAATASLPLPDAVHTLELSSAFARSLPHYLGEVAVALLPIVAFFVIAHFTLLHLRPMELARIIIGLIYTFAGLTLFLLGANMGFMPLGGFLGSTLASLDTSWLLVPLGMLMGYFVVAAEPAVHVLSKQVYLLTAGAIPQKALRLSLSIGVSASVGLAMLRILTGWNILYFLIPGYAAALILMFFVPPVFTSIAFDSGGVASGPMTATFLLPMAMGACKSLGGNVASEAFGVVAMVAMTPLITIQILGLVFRHKQRSAAPAKAAAAPAEEIIE